MAVGSNLLQQAMRHHQEGRLAEAEALYQKLLAAKPGDPDALHLLGLIAQQTGRLEASRDLIGRALARKPRYPAALSNLGNTLRALGHLEEAVGRYRQALALQPGYLEAHLNLGNALHDLGRFDEAIQSYQKALRLQPDLPEAHGNLGNSLRAQGRLEEAVASYRRALALRPTPQDLHVALGRCLRALQRPQEAAAAYRQALDLWPDAPEVHLDLGALLLDLGHWEAATAFSRRAAELLPRDAGAAFNLGLALHRCGDATGALAPLRRALELQPDHPDGWALLAEAFAGAPGLPTDPAWVPTLQALLAQPQVHPAPLRRPILAVLRHLPELGGLLASPPPAREASAALSRLPLLLGLLELAPAIDLEVEGLLTQLRRELVLTAQDQAWPPEGLPFLAALAAQCFINEYVFAQSPDEAEAAERLQVAVTRHLEAEEPIPAHWIAALGAYRPLHTLPGAAALLRRTWPEVLRGLLVRQVAEPLEERRLAAALPTLTPIRDAVSLAVQAQYEENPYPRWMRTRLHAQARPLPEVLRALRPSIPVEGPTGPDLPDILVAGCGTGEHALGTATRFLHRRVLAVDLSRASLGYAARKAREAGLATLDFAQADILALGDLGRSFDLIESAGVLHHMADPLEGWRVLTTLLKPGGLMGIALYSEAARQPVVRARERIARQGWDASPDAIRGFRQSLLRGAPEEDLAWLRSTRDFYSLSECRDLLFHVQEHRFTLPGVEAALARLGLRFLGFEVAPATWARFQASEPEPAAATSLAAWDRFEQRHPEAFRGMYQFWCQKP